MQNSRALAVLAALACAACGGATSPPSKGAGASGGESNGLAGAAGSSGGSAGSAASAIGCEGEITFDPSIEADIRFRLNRPSGPLSGEDVRGMKEVAPFGPVSTLGGVECLVSLKQLWLRESSIDSLAPLAQLTELTGVSFHGSRVTDLSPLAELTELISVGFAGNRVTDLSPLSNKPYLRNVGADGNAISSVSNFPLPGESGCGDNVKQFSLIGNPLTPEAVADLQRFCAAGWWVTWGELGSPSSCNDQCQPRP